MKRRIINYYSWMYWLNDIYLLSWLVYIESLRSLACIWVGMCLHISLSICLYKFICTSNLCVCVYIYIYIYIYVLNLSILDTNTHMHMLHIDIWQHVSCGISKQDITPVYTRGQQSKNRKEMCGCWKYYIIIRDSHIDMGRDSVRFGESSAEKQKY